MVQSLGRTIVEKFSLIGLTFWVLRIGVVFIVAVGMINSLSSGTYSAAQWGDLVIFGIAQGSVYAMIALGYTMVYGILGFINFAHGEVFMTGMMTGFFASIALVDVGLWEASPFLSLIIVLIVTMSTSTLVAVTLERIAYRPLRNAPRLIPLITSIGASFVLREGTRGLVGAGVKTYPRIESLRGTISILGINILKTQTIVIVSAFVMMVGLYLFVERTKAGRAIRAVAEDKEIASLMGINVNRSIVLTFAIGGLMAGAAGLLYALVFSTVLPSTGFVPGIKAFTAAVLGGIGNIVGAMVGGLVLGLVESLGPILILGGLGITAPHQLKDMIAFLVLVLVLIFRPTGLLGERLSEEKA